MQTCLQAALYFHYTLVYLIFVVNQHAIYDFQIIQPIYVFDWEERVVGIFMIPSQDLIGLVINYINKN